MNAAMNATSIGLTLLSVLAIACGQVLFKMAARGAGEGSGSVMDLLNPWLFAALVVYGFATLLWVWVLKTIPLNVAYPFMGFAFVVVPLLAAYFLHESLDWRHLAGGVLIAAGVAVASWR
jgi:drug/metabolite transporter (DMT)-like permease